uniref:(northern house mosquito) hypothetical protein n=1 Tax=Culex pipiens TaxID=7175 RepID=A0A8D8I7P4_CULPI
MLSCSHSVTADSTVQCGVPLPRNVRPTSQRPVPDAGSHHDRSVQLSGGRCYGISLATNFSVDVLFTTQRVVYPRSIDVSAVLLRVKQLLKRCCNNCVRCVNTN